MRDSFTDQVLACQSWGCLTSVRSSPPPLHGSLPAIATTRQSLDKAGILGGVTQGLPQAVHRGADAVLELHNRIVRPQTLAQIFSRYQLARVLQEHDQDSQRLLGERSEEHTSELQSPYDLVCRLL